MEKLVKQIAVWDHCPARIHKQKKLDCILPWPVKHYLQASAVVAGLVYRTVYIKFGLRYIKSGRKLSELTQCHLKLSVIKHPVITEITELALSYNLESRLVSGGPAYPDAAHMTAKITER